MRILSSISYMDERHIHRKSFGFIPHLAKLAFTKLVAHQESSMTFSNALVSVSAIHSKFPQLLYYQ